MSGMQSAMMASKMRREVGVSPHMTKQKSATRMWCANVAWSRSRRPSRRRCTWIEARGTCVKINQ